MADDRPTISSGRLPANEVPQRDFGIVRRGFDPEEVRAFLEKVARELATAERREQELLEELTAAEDRARHPVIDEGVLTHALGQRSAAVLRNAHEEAARITKTTDESAASILREAQQQATEIQVRAESQAAERIAEAELEANALRQQARDEAAAMMDAARAEGEGLIERARDHGRAMVDQAQDARRRVLADMAHRRRLMTEQIEQFRAARDEIASSIVGVRHSVDRIVDDLARADDAARAAAADVARHVTIDAPEAVLVAEGERAAAELGADSGATLAAAGDVVDRAISSQVSLRFDDIATVVERPGDRPDTDRWSPSPAPGASGEAARGEGDAGQREPAGAAQGSPSHGTGRVRSAPRPAPLPPPIAVDPIAVDLAPEPLDLLAEPGGASSDVDGLFARLRARQGTDGRQEGETGPDDADAAMGAGPAGHGGEGDALAASNGNAPAEGRADAESSGQAAATGDEAAPAGGAPAEAIPAGGAPAGQAPAEEAVGAPQPPDAPAEPSAEHVALERRAAALDPIVTAMARRLKRALQDDQNGLLDRLRKGPGTWTDDLLPQESTQRALYAKASSAALRDSMAAGIAFARSMVGGRQGRSPNPDPRTVDAVTGELTSTVVTLLRRRLEGGDIPDAAERVGAAYREWRGERIERLAEDRAIEAFGAGVLAGSARSGGVVWVRGDSGPGCADCEDNALAGSMAPGEEFPTGHRHPPAHAGCRCLVVPAAQ